MTRLLFAAVVAALAGLMILVYTTDGFSARTSDDRAEAEHSPQAVAPAVTRSAPSHGEIPRLSENAVPEFLPPHRMPGEGQDAYETRREVVEGYQEFLRRSGLSPERDKKVRQILADAQLQLVYSLRAMRRSDRKETAETLIDEVRDRSREYRERLREVLTREEMDLLRVTAGDARRVAWAFPFDLRPYILGQR